MDDYDKFMKEEIPFHGMAPSRIIWDISTIGYMINPHWCPSALVEAPYLTDDVRWKAGEKRHSIRVCNFVTGMAFSVICLRSWGVRLNKGIKSAGVETDFLLRRFVIRRHTGESFKFWITEH